MTATTADTASRQQRQAAEPHTTVPPWRPFRVVVSRLQRLSPTFVRVTFTGDDLDQLGHDGPDQRVKLYIPRAGRSIPEFSGADWYAQHRATAPEERGFVRTYTIRTVRPEQRELDIDFVLHGPDGSVLEDRHGPQGPAAAWAASAAIGDELVVIGPNRVFPGDCQGYEWNPPLDARDILIAGDETALPAIAGILDTLRRAELVNGSRTGRQPRIQVFLEIPDAADALDLPVPGHAEITWLPRQQRDGARFGHGELLVKATREASFEAPQPAQDPSAVDTVDIDLQVLWEVAASASSAVYAWVAGEAGAVKAIRRHLVRERGIDKGAVTFMGYWRLGRSLDE